MEIVRLQMELEQSKKKPIAPVINIVLLDNFLKYFQATEDDLDFV